jgi:hypothetical protein
VSPRRGGVVIPLITLIASFMVVLVLGALFATGSSQPPPPPPPPLPTGGGGTAIVQVTVSDLTRDKEVWQAFPGVRLTVTPVPEQGGTSGSVPTSSVERVTVCMIPPPGWKITSDRWNPDPRKGQQNSFCQEFDRSAGKVPEFVLQLERQR